MSDEHTEYVITKAEWRKKHRDYRTGDPRKGTARMLRMVNGVGTCMVPVRVTDPVHTIVRRERTLGHMFLAEGQDPKGGLAMVALVAVNDYTEVIATITPMYPGCIETRYAGKIILTVDFDGAAEAIYGGGIEVLPPLTART